MTARGSAIDDLWHNLRGTPAADAELCKLVDEIVAGRWTAEQVAILSEIVFRVRMAVGDLGMRIGECEKSDTGLHLFNSAERCIHCGYKPGEAAP